MSLLAPLYIAGILSVALPILFHLIRKTPKDRQVFSSLMFLSPSPPRLSRRSRLTNILLLILRAAALALLAIAFARPFFYRNSDVNISSPKGKRLALLVDTSASMRRGDLWDQARRQVNQAVADLSPGDEVALYLFDRTVHPAFTFDQWNQTELTRRVPLLLARLNEASPTWSSTNLGEALAGVADQLAESHDAAKSTEISRRQITLISDLQQGAHVEALQGHEWPEGVLLEVKALTLPQTTNASLLMVKPTTDSPDPHPEQLRIRVTNQPGSKVEQFTLAWANAQGVLPTVEPMKVYTPAGRSEVVRVPWPPLDQHADHLVLQGDDFDFDNTLYLVQPSQTTMRVVYVGDDAADDAKGLSYYLGSTLVDTPQRKMEFMQRGGAASDRAGPGGTATTRMLDPQDPGRRNTSEPGVISPLTATDLNAAALVVVSSDLSDDQVALLQHFAEAGGTVLWVLKDTATAPALSRLSKIEAMNVEESTDVNFALISRVDVTSSVFTAFIDPQFADFSKIHFWHHRLVKVPENSGARAIATFDNGDPFLLEKPIGQGRLLIATAGWQPADSQLALSTKFVPLMGGMIPQKDTSTAESQRFVGDTLADGTVADHPGVFATTMDGKPATVAVNLNPDESRTTPLAAADLSQWGAHVGVLPPAQVLVAQQRQLKLFELENRQKLWRWLVCAVLGLVAGETIVAGRLARRSPEPALAA